MLSTGCGSARRQCEFASRDRARRDTRRQARCVGPRSRSRNTNSAAHRTGRARRHVWRPRLKLAASAKRQAARKRRAQSARAKSQEPSAKSQEPSATSSPLPSRLGSRTAVQPVRASTARWRGLEARVLRSRATSSRSDAPARTAFRIASSTGLSSDAAVVSSGEGFRDHAFDAGDRQYVVDSRDERRALRKQSIAADVPGRVDRARDRRHRASKLERQSRRDERAAPCHPPRSR